MLVQSRKATPRAYLVTLLLRRNLRAHMKYEEEQVLTQYQELVAEPALNATVSMFWEDHKLILESLDRLMDLWLQASFKTIDPSLAREEIALLAERLEHHDVREKRELYAKLGELLPDREQKKLLKGLSRVPLIPWLTVAVTTEDWCHGVAWDQATMIYATWTGHRRDLEETQVLDRLVGRKSAATLQKLRERDLKLLESWRENPPVGLRKQLAEERRLEQTLRSTVRFAFNAALDRFLGNH